MTCGKFSQWPQKVLQQEKQKIGRPEAEKKPENPEKTIYSQCSVTTPYMLL